MRDVRTLGEIAARTSVLSVACSRCERRGRYRLDKLITRYGADAGGTGRSRVCVVLATERGCAASDHRVGPLQS